MPVEYWGIDPSGGVRLAAAYSVSEVGLADDDRVHDGWRRLSSSNGCEDDDSCQIESAGDLLKIYIVWGGVNTGMWLLWRICTRDFDRSWHGYQESSLGEAARILVEAVMLGVFWPLTWGYIFVLAPIISCLGRVDIFDALEWPFQACLQFILRFTDRRAAGRETTQQLSRRLHTTSEPWRRRGWLVMMRDRHQRSLGAKRPVALRARLRLRCFGRPRELAYSKAMKSAKAYLSDIGQQELGWPQANFVGAVVTAVEIEEEGLFRRIIMHL